MPSGRSSAARDRDALRQVPAFVSAVHAYEVTEALTYVKDGNVLPHYQA